MQAQFILYVRDQKRSADFYAYVLNLKPQLDVPGMTEFSLNDGCVLGLMPESGIRKLLGPQLPDPAAAGGVPRAEMYIRVDYVSPYHARAIEMGATELSPLQPRDWGECVAYSLDLDGHVLAFAQKQ